MIITGRRRGGGEATGYRLTLPSTEMALHGGGYPITCELALPAGTGPVTAQWRRNTHTSWTTVPPAPAGRFDGISTARRDGDRILISVPFPEGHPELHVRAIDTSGTEVGTWVGITENYDDRDVAFIITYDDNPSVADWETSTATHQATGVWMSPGLNPGLWATGYKQLIEDATAGGCIEPINHSWGHVNLDGSTDQQAATEQVTWGRDALLALSRPPQSRGRSHGYIYPYGAHPDVVKQALSNSGHITARRTIDWTLDVDGGAYTIAPIDPSWGIIAEQRPSLAPNDGTIQARVSSALQSAGAQRVLDGLAHARDNQLSMVHVYAYIRHYDWGASDPWPQMLATAGASADVWSVGYGHHALYHRTRDELTVTPMST